MAGGRSEPRFVHRVPDGDNRARRICEDCGFIAYENPRIVAGSVVRHDGRILLCRRAIEPRHGFWTIPAGYLELGESPDEGAMREALEEANARIAISGVLAIYSIRRLSQVQIFYRATLAEPAFSAGEETLEARLFAWDEVPWDDLAFPSVAWALHHDRSADRGEAVPPFINPDGATGDMTAR